MRNTDGWPYVNGTCRCPLDEIQTHHDKNHDALVKWAKENSKGPNDPLRKLLRKTERGPKF